MRLLQIRSSMHVYQTGEFITPSYLPGIKAIFWKTNDEWYADMADQDDDKGIQLYIQNRMQNKLEQGIE